MDDDERASKILVQLHERVEDGSHIGLLILFQTMQHVEHVQNDDLGGEDCEFSSENLKPCWIVQLEPSPDRPLQVFIGWVLAYRIALDNLLEAPQHPLERVLFLDVDHAT